MSEQTINKPQIGQPVSRLEGHLKVTGGAKYAGEYNVDGLLYGYVVSSTITKGKIVKIHSEEILAMDGISAIFTHENRPSLARFDMQYSDMDAPPGSPFRPLHDENIKSNGQPIALIVAETFELARYAASVLRVDYETEEFETDLEANLEKARNPQPGIATFLKPLPPKDLGKARDVFDSAPAKASGYFTHGTEHHNPMELFATTTVYEGKGKVTIYDKTQGTVNCQLYVGNVFGLRFKNVRVISPYVGGAFGSGLRPQYQLFFSVMAALELKRNVRVTLDRSQMFTIGHRPPTIQITQFSADKHGKLSSIRHEAIAETSQYEDYTEVVVNWAPMIYPSSDSKMKYQLVPLDVHSPLDMRAPGGSTGLHAIESTMDELSYAVGIDPIDLRLVNYADTDESVGRPYSSKELRECYLQGAKKFGWEKRSAEPRSMRNGNKLIGYGMATGIWESMIVPARIEAILTPEGKLVVKSAVTDIGTGTLTVMTQIAADELGLSLEDVSFEYGDSKMPFAPIQGGSFTVSTVGSAIMMAGKALRKKLLKAAKRMDKSPFEGAKVEEVLFESGFIRLKTKLEVSVALKDIIAINGGKPISTKNFNIPNLLKLKKYSRAVHSAAFAEVEVDEELGVITVKRALTTVAAGKIINPKTARSQILGGMVWAISKTLHEETISDNRFGKYMNQNLGEYHIPVHADIHDLDVVFVNEEDNVVNQLGSKGIGEIGLVGMPPAIANAIYHATGKRINQMPIHFDKLL
ncbi:MAG: xanthine dehydrogenase family protein molybdopterin-binding subunit [Pedobacter sp.]|nr:MAG: xanthine dehydrogenase family protein molybdopterin-binding subunit [Pedobacter sp.]